MKLFNMLPFWLQFFLIMASAVACGFAFGVLPFIMAGRYFSREIWDRIKNMD